MVLARETPVSRRPVHQTSTTRPRRAREIINQGFRIDGVASQIGLEREVYRDEMAPVAGMSDDDVTWEMSNALDRGFLRRELSCLRA